MSTLPDQGIDAYAVNAAPFGGTFNWWQTLSPGENQLEVPAPLMVTKINHGVVYVIPPDPVFVVGEDETFTLSPEVA